MSSTGGRLCWTADRTQAAAQTKFTYHDSWMQQLNHIQDTFISLFTDRMMIEIRHRR